MLVIGFTAVTTASKLEDHDQFCASCHMQPEVAYEKRAQLVVHSKVSTTDLASQHYVTSESQLAKQPFRCIDCQRGDQILGDRATELLIGANDLVIYFAGTPKPDA